MAPGGLRQGPLHSRLYSVGTMAGCGTGSGSMKPIGCLVRGPINSLAMNSASSTAPTLKIMSPGTRIHTSVSMTALWTISGERAYQKPVVMLW